MLNPLQFSSDDLPEVAMKQQQDDDDAGGVSGLQQPITA